VASSETHDLEALDKFVTEKLEKMLLPKQIGMNDGYIDRYVVYRIYKTSSGQIKRAGYCIEDYGYVSLCSYDWDENSNDWIPSGFDTYNIDFNEFKTQLKECLSSSALDKN
jgi:hypothetical protein